MKVILTKDVKDIGRAHEMIDASDGHALNFLIPKKLAIPATPGAIKVAEGMKAQETSRKEVTAQLVAQNLATLAEARIVIKAKVNEKGHLYDAVGEDEILAALKEQVHIELPEGTLRIEKPFKEVGTFEIPVAAGDIFGTFSITVEAE